MVLIGGALQTFAEWLKEELDNRGWTRAELARRSKLQEATFTYIFGGRKPSPETCNAIAGALGIPSETVFRKAGLLPANPEDDEKLLNEVVEAFKRLDINQRQAVLEYALFEFRRSRNKGEQEFEDIEGNQNFSDIEREEKEEPDSGLIPE